MNFGISPSWNFGPI